MAGWTHQKRVVVEDGFFEFLGRAHVFSKDLGDIVLGDHLYDGQRKLYTTVFDALEEDIHDIYVLKSRQLGASTGVRALTVFMLGFHEGVRGACVFDTFDNRKEARAELSQMIRRLPASLRFPKIVGDNAQGLELENGSKMLFLSAGVRASKTSGGLGRSLGLSVSHMSEICSYDNDEGLEAFRNSLSDTNPDRLYINESTARGFNKWFDMWQEARQDTQHCRCLFLGPWSKPSQTIPRSHPDFKIYGEFPPTQREHDKIEQVRDLYGVQVTPEQLAWMRRKMDPAGGMMVREGETPEFEGSADRIQEQPWTEWDAFQQTGATFFSPQTLTDQTNRYVNAKFKGYFYTAGEEFIEMRAWPATMARQVQLKVWEEPEPQSTYVVGVDPAYGENEKNNRSAIQVLRCYADGIDQVAEYASPLVNTRNLAWVLASILGWYGFGNNEVRYIMELQGPGAAVFNALKDLQVYLRIGHHKKIVDEKGLGDIFRNVQTYIYQRPDSMAAGHNWHWVTNQPRKVMILEALRDFVSNGTLRIRSLELVAEMNKIRRDGNEISGHDDEDDRVLAAAFAAHYWLERIKTPLMASKRTREREQQRKNISIKDQVALFNQNHLETFFAAKRRQRLRGAAVARRRSWRYG